MLAPFIHVDDSTFAMKSGLRFILEKTLRISHEKISAATNWWSKALGRALANMVMDWVKSLSQSERPNKRLFSSGGRFATAMIKNQSLDSSCPKVFIGNCHSGYVGTTIALAP